MFNRSEKTPVEKKILIAYASGFAVIYWFVFSIFAEILFGAYYFFVFIWFMVELTYFLFVSFEKT